jgi:hypothetical protein
LWTRRARAVSERLKKATAAVADALKELAAADARAGFFELAGRRLVGDLRRRAAEDGVSGLFVRRQQCDQFSAKNRIAGAGRFEKCIALFGRKLDHFIEKRLQPRMLRVWHASQPLVCARSRG